MENMKTISKEKAMEIALVNFNGFLGTWITVYLKNGNWHFHASSKSSSPPIYCIINGQTGKIIYKNENIDTKKIPEKYLNTQFTKKYLVEKNNQTYGWIEQ